MKLKLYTVNHEYCSFLRSYDPCVPYNDKEKKHRPFVGVVLHIQNQNFYAPLTSPKPKHQYMKHALDFVQIAEGKLGGINLNNMIPIEPSDLIHVDTGIHLEDSKQIIQYKYMLRKQIHWCNQHKDFILEKANLLFKLYENHHLPESIKQRCCNFTLDLEILEKYKDRVIG